MLRNGTRMTQTTRIFADLLPARKIKRMLGYQGI